MNYLDNNPIIVTISDAPFTSGAVKRKVFYNNELRHSVPGNFVVITVTVKHYESDGITKINNPNFSDRTVQLVIDNNTFVNPLTGVYCLPTDPEAIGEYDFYMNLLFKAPEQPTSNIRDLIIAGLTMSDQHPDGSRYNIK